ncbi:MAG: phage major capsid protein [Sphingobacteriia bacterium]|nr:phage major capsid protein [Sphingobacteriia bacterium]
MNLNDITNQVNQLANHWDDFKEINNRRLEQLEKKGTNDCLDDASLNNLNVLIEDCQNKIKSLETTLSRPNVNNTEFKGFDQNLEHKNAFNNYLRKGNEQNLHLLEKKALSVISDQDGGYFVTHKIKHNIYNNINNIVPMRQLASIQNISTDTLEIIEDYQKADAGWSNEISSINETSTPKVSKKLIPVHEIYAQPKATQKLIDDASIDIEAWLEDKLTKSFADLEDHAFIKGDGIGKPKGILSYSDGKEWGKIEQVNSGFNNNLTAGSIIKLLYSLQDIYSAKASFLMNRNITFLIRTLKNESGQYLWSPSLSQGQPETLLGLPVYHSDAMPVQANNALAIAVGDFKSAYQIVDRANIKVMRDPFTEKPFVKFYTTKRVGGDVVNFNAIKLLKLSA